MQIKITFTCRKCGQDQTLITDTSEYGLLSDPYIADNAPVVDPATILELRCTCNYISGDIGMGYRFRGPP